MVPHLLLLLQTLLLKSILFILLEKTLPFKTSSKLLDLLATFLLRGLINRRVFD
jgi:hypothetical protein